MPKSKRKGLKGRGGVGKAVVAGIKDRATNKVRAQVVTSPDAENLQGFVRAKAVVTPVKIKWMKRPEGSVSV